MKALVIVDVQNDFFPGGSLEVKNADVIVPVINKIQQKFDLILATKDWHPENHVSFAVNHGKKPGEIIKFNGQDQILWPVHCVQNTKGADFVPGLNTSKIKKVFYKGMDKKIDSYSGFFDNEHKKSTGLGDYLNKKNVKDVYIVGVATDYCVKFTALDSISLGFNTFVILDATKGVDLKDGDVENATREMGRKRVTIINKDVILL